MEKSIKDLLEEEIESGMSELSHHDYSNDTRTKILANLEKTHKMYDVECKREDEREAAWMQYKLEKAKLEEEKRHKKAQRKDKLIEILVPAGVGAALFVGECVWCTLRYHEGLEFEKTGTITSPQVRNLIPKVSFPKSRR